jgi:hypothetical protein
LDVEVFTFKAVCGEIYKRRKKKKKTVDGLRCGSTENNRVWARFNHKLYLAYFGVVAQKKIMFRPDSVTSYIWFTWAS